MNQLHSLSGHSHTTDRQGHQGNDTIDTDIRLIVWVVRGNKHTKDKDCTNNVGKTQNSGRI